MNVNLEFIHKKAPFFAWTWQVLAAAMISCTLMIMYNGHWQDFITTAVIGGLGYACYYFINTTFKIKFVRSEEHTSELQSRFDLVCRLLLEKKNNKLIQ